MINSTRRLGTEKKTERRDIQQKSRLVCTPEEVVCVQYWHTIHKNGNPLTEMMHTRGDGKVGLRKS